MRKLPLRPQRRAKWCFAKSRWDEPPRKPKPWSSRRSRPSVPNMVWYNYRRVPAVVLLKQLLDQGRLRPHLSLPLAILAGLDHLAGPAARRRRAMAAGRFRSRQRRHRRLARAQHRHGALAERAHHRSSGDDGNVHQRTQAQSHRQRCSPLPSTMPAPSWPIRQWIDGHVRSHALCPRPQSALHLEINGEQRFRQVGSA